MSLFDFFRGKPATAGGEEVLIDLLRPYHRNAWLPLTRQARGGVTASKFSGLPALPAGEAWPACAHCGQPMQLFLQLNSAQLPQLARDAFGDGILQVFYCTSEASGCEQHCEAYFPFAESTLVRVISHDCGPFAALAASPVKGAYPERVIEGWQQSEDYPELQELEMLGLRLNEEQLDAYFASDYAKPGDKLLGWPSWVQGIEYPYCPECEQPMQLVFQIDSEDNLPYMFGDSGCAHITRCRQHPHRLAIAWSCY